MGGFLAHFPDEEVVDVDMTVEEGVRSVITSGVAAPDDANPGPESIADLGDISYVGDIFREEDEETPGED